MTRVETAVYASEFFCVKSYGFEVRSLPLTFVRKQVITGFLGSGKTTLLKHILTEQHGRRIAVLENEFGETSIDDQLIRQKLTAAEHIVVADNGCLCCTVRGDLVKMIGEVLDRNATVDDDSKIEAIMVRGCELDVGHCNLLLLHLLFASSC